MLMILCQRQGFLEGAVAGGSDVIESIIHANIFISLGHNFREASPTKAQALIRPAHIHSCRKALWNAFSVLPALALTIVSLIAIS